MSVTQITDDNIDTGIDASKLSGSVLPAMDGSALTNINVGTSLLKYGFNPAVDTNPADGVGAIWINTATGQMFSCTDATTDQNTWTNMGSGTGHITYVPPVYQGTQYGYVSGGTGASVERFSFTTDENSYYIGDLDTPRVATTGVSSYTHGYAAGHNSSNMNSIIDKFSFYGSYTATFVGSLSSPNWHASGSSSSTHGYAAGGHVSGPPADSLSAINKFSFAADGNSSNIGNLTISNGRTYVAGHSSTTHGYSCGGLEIYPQGGNGALSSVDKFSFSADGNAVAVGNLSRWKNQPAGCSSATHAYNAGGYVQASVPWGGSSGHTTETDKFAFASDGNAAIVSYLSQSGYGLAGSSSVNNGYAIGGSPSGALMDSIQKISFISDTTSVVIGTMTTGRYLLSAHQV